MPLVVVERFIYFYVHFKCIFCPNEISEVFKIFGILQCKGYKFGVNDLKAREGVIIFVL